MSTLADLFNNRISFSRKIVLAEKFSEKYLVYIIHLKGEEPLKVELFRADNDNLFRSLTEHGISKEDLYIILHPGYYYKNSIQLPFTDPQRIESVIDNEIIDYLPYDDSAFKENQDNQSHGKTEYVVDFDIFHQRIIAYSIGEDLIGKVIQNLGIYSDNLKAIIPYGSILRDFFSGYLDFETLKRIIMVECNDDGVEIWGFSNDINGEIVQKIDQYNVNNVDKIVSVILRIKKFYQEERYILSSKIDCKIPLDDIENKYDLRHYRIDFRKYVEDLPEYNIDENYKLTLYGFLKYLQKKDKRVNLLKGQFKPSLKNYIKVKDFVLAGILVLTLLGFSAGRFFTDISFLKSRVTQLKYTIYNLTEKSFGKRLTSVKSAIALLNSVKNESGILERNINRKYSALELFKEFTAALPVDVELEYTDIFIDQHRIRFTGKTKSFSDIDKIKESLQNSEYFKEVNVINSGTTGSTGGFIVNFQFDIKCNVE